VPTGLRLLCVLALLGGLVPSALPTQEAPVMAESGARVLIRLERGPEIRGTLLAVRADSLMLRTQMEPRLAVARDEIRDIKRSMGRTRLRGGRQVFLGVSGMTLVVCWAVIGVAGAFEGHPDALVLAPLFCAPGAAVFGLFGGALGLLIKGDQWVPATLPATSPATSPEISHP
jgi:hypothetical protein